MENISEILKLLRKQNNISQMQLAKLTNLSQSTIANIEKGRNEATISTLVALSDFFHISTDYLIGREEDDGRIVVKELELPVDERKLINYYRELPEELKNSCIEYAKTLNSLNKNIKNK